MITIKDKSLGKYFITQDHQGMKVCSEKTTLTKVNNLEQALGFIAERLLTDKDEEVNLAGYNKLKSQVAHEIISAQTIEHAMADSTDEMEEDLEDTDLKGNEENSFLEKA